VRALTRVPGIGKKTAQHVFLELKYKLDLDAEPAILPPAEGPASVFRDALGGLVNLGYAEEECVPLIKKILSENPDFDVADILKSTLKALAKGTQ
jgi:Holliday junction DNA helicase RuvA